MRSLYKPPPPKLSDILSGIKVALEKLLSRKEAPPSVTVAAPNVKVENPITVLPPHKCGWVFRVTERDKLGNISTFTATPVHDRNGSS